METTADPRERLRALLELASGEMVNVRSAKPLAGGASMETWAVDADVGGVAERLVVRRDMGANMHPDALTRPQEFEVLRRAVAAGVKAPRPRWCVEAARAPDGRAYFVMDRVDGESVGRRVVKLPELAEARRGMAREMGRELARVHAIARDEALRFLPAPGDDGDPCAQAERVVRGMMDAMARHNPTWALTLRWLSTHRPPPAARGPLVVLHGDFRVGNLLVAPAGLAAVIDWEFAHVGDIHEDLAWPLMRDWRFEQDHHRVGGVGALDDLLAGYAEAGGATVDPATLAWWELMGNLRWSVTCHAQAERHLSGRDPSVEYASLGRKSAEMEWEMLALMEGAALPGPDMAMLASLPPPASADIPSLRPTAAELLEAVREHLTKRVAPSITDAPLRYQTLVAAHVVGVVGREMSAGAVPFERVREERGALPGAPADDRALCAAITAGDFDGDAEARALRAHLARRTGLFLLAWNPLFLARASRPA